MVDSIVHEKMQNFTNQMWPFYKSPSEEESGNDKNCSPNISTTTSANAFTMENIEQMIQKCSKTKIQNQTAETTINPHWLHRDTMKMVYLSLTSGIIESNKIFATTANIS